MTGADADLLRTQLGDHRNAADVLAYVTGCLDGTILACPDIRQACERFVTDLADPRWEFRPAEAEYAIELIETMLCHHTKMVPVGTKVGIKVDPFNIQIMKKPESEDEEAIGVNE